MNPIREIIQCTKIINDKNSPREAVVICKGHRKDLVTALREEMKRTHLFWTGLANAEDINDLVWTRKGYVAVLGDGSRVNLSEFRPWPFEQNQWTTEAVLAELKRERFG